MGDTVCKIFEIFVFIFMGRCLGALFIQQIGYSMELLLQELPTFMSLVELDPHRVFFRVSHCANSSYRPSTVAHKGH